jgi:DNA invertase Pin-like site-specific DNA recombinase
VQYRTVPVVPYNVRSKMQNEGIVVPTFSREVIKEEVKERIRELLKQNGMNKDIVVICNVSVSTVEKIKKQMKEEGSLVDGTEKVREKVRELLKQGVNRKEIVSICGVSPDVATRIKKEMLDEGIDLPPKTKEERVEEARESVRELLKLGIALKDIVAMCNVSKSTVERINEKRGDPFIITSYS